MGVYQKVKGKKEPWWIDYRYKGKRYRQMIGTKKKEAEEALAQIKIKIAAGDFVPKEERVQEENVEPESVLFETFAQDEFLPWSETQHSRNHYVRQEKALRVHLIPYFEGRSLHEITAKMIEDYKTARIRARYVAGKKRKPVSKSTVNRELSCLKMLFTQKRHPGCNFWPSAATFQREAAMSGSRNRDVLFTHI